MCVLHPYADIPMIVVSGLGRSGTTLLRNCIAAHPEIDARNQESNYLFSLMRGGNLAMEDEFLVRFLAVKTSEFWNLHREMILNLCWPKVQKANSSVKAIATYTKLDPRAAMGLEKTFKRLSIIYALRNGIEVVSSFQSFKPFQNLSFADACRLWSIRYDMFQYCRDNEHATLIRYELLASDQEKWEASIDECLQRVGLSFHDGCRKPLSKPFAPTRFEGESRQDAKDLSKRKDRWRLWTEEQKDVFVDVCGQAMQDLGYEIPWL